MPDGASQTLTYEPQPLRAGLIVCESPDGVVVRLRARPLWQDVCLATAATLVAASLCTLLAILVCTDAGALRGARDWFALTGISAWAAMVALDAVQRTRGRVRGDPTVNTVFLHAADHPFNPVTEVEVTFGPLGMDLTRPVKLRVEERVGDWTELAADGSLEDVERAAAELRRVLRLPAVE
jgi:hypothetical protein